jgi:2-polyprenyl-3-methyl-5-hydroxy-6-metoxy-1,4-benzoquinol methylase
MDERKRLSLQLKIYTPAFKQAIRLCLDKFDLRTRLENPQATFRILDLGCGEGLYFPILAELLSEEGARAKIEMVGLDRDAHAIEVGQDYVWTLGLHNVRLGVHDFTKPFSNLDWLKPNQNPALTSEEATLSDRGFDLVYTSVVLMHQSVPVLNSLLRNIHAELLKPGGAFFTKDMSWTQGASYPLPAFNILVGVVGAGLSKVLGVDFALHQPEYLREAGFADIETFEDTYPIGGKSQNGRFMLNNIILSHHAGRDGILKMGLIGAQEFDAAVEEEFKQVSPNLEGQLTLQNTVARRPA